MAFPNSEKKRLVDGSGLTDRTLYVALGIGTTELTGHGYSRGASPQANNTSDNAGVVSIASGQEIYTPRRRERAGQHAHAYRAFGGGGGLGDRVAAPQQHRRARERPGGQHREHHHHALMGVTTSRLAGANNG